jgi:hypothetical protein
VTSLDYGGSLGEQVRDGETGFLCRTASKLAGLIERLRNRNCWSGTWSEESRRVAAAVFEGVS